MRMFPDIITRTLAFSLLSMWFLQANNWKSLLELFIIAVFVAVRSRLYRALVGVAIFAPTLPILVSHFGVEPLLGGQEINLGTAFQAAQAWLRLVGMVLISLAWINSLNILAACQLCRLLGFGQAVLTLLMTTATSLRTTRQRWTAIREAHALQQTGLLARRKLIPLRHVPSTGLQLLMSSLVSTNEVALACDGRGIGSKRYLAVRLPRPSVRGAISMILMILVTWAMFASGYASL